MMEAVIQAQETMFFAEVRNPMQNIMAMENAQQDIKTAMVEGFWTDAKQI